MNERASSHDSCLRSTTKIDDNWRIGTARIAAAETATCAPNLGFADQWMWTLCRNDGRCLIVADKATNPRAMKSSKSEGGSTVHQTCLRQSTYWINYPPHWCHTAIQ